MDGNKNLRTRVHRKIICSNNAPPPEKKSTGLFNSEIKELKINSEIEI